MTARPSFLFQDSRQPSATSSPDEIRTSILPVKDTVFIFPLRLSKISSCLEIVHSSRGSSRYIPGSSPLISSRVIGLSNLDFPTALNSLYVSTISVSPAPLYPYLWTDR